MTSLGQSLREEREARNISLEEIASATKIVPRYLEALESDRLDLMPGGFFVKGIIRTYARAVGLDPDAVIERYRAAGLLEGPERDRPPVSQGASPSARADEIRAGARPASADARLDAGAAETENAAPSLLIEEAARARLSPDARRRLHGWLWRGLAALVVVGVGLVLWSPWRHRSPALQTQTAAQTEPSPAPVSTVPATEKPAGDSARQAAQPPAAPTAPQTEPAAAPAVEEVWKGVTIEIVFEAETWIQVYTDGQLQVGGTFPAGATARATAAGKLLIHTGNAGGFTFKLNGRPAKPLGRSGQVLTDIKITPENLKDFLESPSSGGPAG